MNRYTLLWLEAAIDQLAEIWLAAPDRHKINQAINALDALLSSDPLGDLTRELREELRATTVGAVRAIYTVQEAGRTVEIAAVRRVRDEDVPP